MILIPLAKPSKPSTKYIAFIIAIIHNKLAEKPIHVGKLIMPIKGAVRNETVKSLLIIIKIDPSIMPNNLALGESSFMSSIITVIIIIEPERNNGIDAFN